MPCPLCHSDEAIEVERIAFEDIYEALAREWDAELTDDVKERHAPQPETAVVRCTGCGLEYFTPAIAGDGDFYDQVTASPRYYTESRWEFDVISSRTAGDRSVVDLGAGTGAFLRSIAGRGGRLVGVDLSSTAVEGLRRAGLEAHQQSFSAFANSHASQFDVVTGFHIVEHLEDIDEFLTAAATLLRKGGRLFISTPNRDRDGRRDLEPLDCPPHHMSRWSPRQMAEAASRYGFELAEVHFEPVSLAQLGHHVEQLTGRTVRRALRLAGLVPLTYRGLERLGRVPRHESMVGASILGEMVRR